MNHGAPASLGDLTGLTGLHENTLRGHLTALRTAGHVSRFGARSTGPGRPAWLWVARESPYVALARALARGIEAAAGGTPEQTGERGGLAWGEALSELFAAAGRTPDERLMLALEHVGFGPETTAEGHTIRLTSCPFTDTARTHPGAVCSVHLGLIEGVLGDAGAVSTLVPFAEPGACLLKLTAEGPR